MNKKKIKQPTTTRCSFVINPDIHRKIKLSAIYHNMTMSEVLTEAVQVYFEKYPERLIKE